MEEIVVTDLVLTLILVDFGENEVFIIDLIVLAIG